MEINNKNNNTDKNIDNSCVSVIIPYYKSYKTIDRALSSVFNQTKDFVCEIIIIDDASPTKEDNHKLNELSKHELIKVIKLDYNQGPGAARNYGMDISKGKYIAFLDSDDAWHPQKFEIQMKILINESAFLSSHKSSEFKKNTSVNMKPEVKNVNPYLNLVRNKIPTRSVILRNTKNYRFNPAQRYCEDFLLWSEIMFSNEKTIIIDEVLSYSFKADYGQGGLTQDIFKMHLGNLNVYKTLYKQGYIHYSYFLILKVAERLKHIVRRFKTKDLN